MADLWTVIDGNIKWDREARKWVHPAAEVILAAAVPRATAERLMERYKDTLGHGVYARPTTADEIALYLGGRD